MNVARMRLLDRWLGTPVCFLLTLWRKVFGRRTPDRSFVPRRILFVKLAEQGSTVLAQGALNAAVRRVGRDNVYFLVFGENRPILDLLDVIPRENVVTINAAGLLRAFWGALSAIWKLRRTGIDAVIDLEFFARSSAALSYLSGARWRVGYHAFGGEASYRGDLMTHRLSFNPYLHTSQTFQIMVEALDCRRRRIADLRAGPHAGTDWCPVWAAGRGGRCRAPDDRGPARRRQSPANPSQRQRQRPNPATEMAG